MMQRLSVVSSVSKVRPLHLEAQHTGEAPVPSKEALSIARGTKNLCWTAHTVHLIIAGTLRMQVSFVIIER